MIKDWEAQLSALEAENHLRTLAPAELRHGVTVEVAGRPLINFSSNDYLALSQHPRVINAARDAAAQWGTGSGGSRLVTGSLSLHTELEDTLARFKGTASALAFSSGYLTAFGLVQTLSRRADGSAVPVYFDRLTHASLVDAVRHSDSRWRSFPHNDPAGLEKLLQKQAAAKPTTASPSSSSSPSPAPTLRPSAIVMTEGVFSMDGDMAPLPELLEVCRRHGAVLVIDDAHGTGTVGPYGRGSVAHFKLPPDAPDLIQMGTLSKALGSQGGFIAGPAPFIRLLISRARTFIYDTALAPPSAAAALESLRILQEEPDHVTNLRRNVTLLRTAIREQGDTLNVGNTNCLDAPIVPVIIGNAGAAMTAARELREKGHLVTAIRPPTVPPGTSRLRLTVTAAHNADQITALVGDLPRIS